MATVAIRRRKLYEDVADHLDKMIQAGAYSPSDLLPSERDLLKRIDEGADPREVFLAAVRAIEQRARRLPASSGADSATPA